VASQNRVTTLIQVGYPPPLLESLIRMQVSVRKTGSDHCCSQLSMPMMLRLIKRPVTHRKHGSSCNVHIRLRGITSPIECRTNEPPCHVIGMQLHMPRSVGAQALFVLQDVGELMRNNHVHAYICHQWSWPVTRKADGLGSQKIHTEHNCAVRSIW